MNGNFLNKELILTRVDFDKENKPRLKFANSQTKEILNFTPTFERSITLEIDTSKRFCIGWHSLETGEDFVCPENATVDKKYEQCSACQKRTGFDPAFYNASQGDISEQQQIRNSQPHFVYLAYFSDEIIKVGISFAGRGMARLLEQGARSALILGEFSSANVARSYEEKISKMTDFCENVKASVKEKLLENSFDFSKASKKLLDSKAKIEKALNVSFEKNNPISFDDFFGKIPATEMISVQDCTENTCEKIIFSGILKAQVGYILIAEQQGEFITIPLRKFTGYKIKLSNEISTLTLPERQASLFDF